MRTDDDAATQIDVQRVAIDPSRLEGAILACPPLIAVARTKPVET